MDKKHSNFANNQPDKYWLKKGEEFFNPIPPDVIKDAPSENYLHNKKKTKRNKKRIIIVWLIGLLSFISLISLLLFIYLPGDISIEITDSKDGAYIRDANIFLDNKQLAQNINYKGIFIINFIKPGKHTLKFEKKDFETYKQEITIKAGESKKLSVRLSLHKKTPKLKGLNLVVVNSTGNTVSIINTNDFENNLSVSVGNNPFDSIVLKEKGKIYVSNLGDDSVSVISTNNFQEIKKIKFPAGSYPSQIEISPQGEKLYVRNSSLNSISVIDTNTDSILENLTISLDKSNLLKNFIINPLNGEIFAVYGSNLAKINGHVSTMQLFPIQNLSADKITSTNDNGLLLINSVDNSVIHFVTGNNTETRFVIGNLPVDAKINPLTNQLYILSAHTLSIFDLNIGNKTKEIDLTGLQSGEEIKFSPDGKNIYITDGILNSIFIFDTINEKLLERKISSGLKSPKNITFLRVD